MGWTETQMIAMISTALNDAATSIWGTATIAAQMLQDLKIIDEWTPQLAKATVAFAGTARELSLASISDLIDVEEVEFPIDEHPRRYVNFTKRGSSVILDNYLPSVSTSDTAYIWYSAPNTVSGTATNTLNPSQAGILVQLTASHLFQNISPDRLEEVNIGGGYVWNAYLQMGREKEKGAMNRLRALVSPNMAVRYPDVK